jgi:putative membrane protein
LEEIPEVEVKRMNKRLKILSFTCAVLLVAGGAAMRAQSSDSSASPADKKFVTDALKGGMAEVKLGQMAADKGNSQDVKNFGQKMVTDHTAMGDKMKEVAGEIGVTPPSMLAAKDVALEAKLKLLSGDAFDKAYIQAMLKDHREDLMAFNNEITGGTSPQVKSAAEDGKKVIAEHLHMIRKISQTHQAQMKPATAGANASGN